MFSILIGLLTLIFLFPFFVACRTETDIKRLRKLVKLGKSFAQNILGEMHQHGLYGVTQSDEKALNLYTLSADNRDAVGMTRTAHYYYHGIGVKQSRTTARKMFEFAAREGGVAGKKEDIVLVKFRYINHPLN